MTSVGDYLKKEREARNLDLREVAELTKISARYLSCIENGDYDQLPPGPYAKGYIAAYARQVCGDETQALALYSESREARRRVNGGAEAHPTAPLSLEKGGYGSADAGVTQDTKATRRIKLIRPKKRAGGFNVAQTLRNLLPEAGNLRHLSASGTARKSAFSTRLKWVSDALKRLTVSFGKLPRAVVRRGLLAASGLLLGALILVLAGFGAYHLFVFEADAPRAPQAEVGPPPLPEPEPEAAAAKGAAASSATAPSAPDRAVDSRAGAASQARRGENLDGEMQPAAPVEKKTSGAGPPDAPDAPESDTITRKKPDPELKPKPTTPAVAVQGPAEIDAAAPSTATAPAGTKVPLVLNKASICTAIEDRMPVGVGERFAWTTPRIFVWSLLGASDPPATVHHRYFFEDELVSDVTLKVGSSYWRTWSFHTLSGQLHIGDWHVDITTEDGRVLRRLHFVIE
jgi:hypothetical protein